MISVIVSKENFLLNASENLIETPGRHPSFPKQWWRQRKEADRSVKVSKTWHANSWIRKRVRLQSPFLTSTPIQTPHRFPSPTLCPRPCGLKSISPSPQSSHPHIWNRPQTERRFCGCPPRGPHYTTPGHRARAPFAVGEKYGSHAGRGLGPVTARVPACEEACSSSPLLTEGSAEAGGVPKRRDLLRQSWCGQANLAAERLSLWHGLLCVTVTDMWRHTYKGVGDGGGKAKRAAGRESAKPNHAPRGVRRAPAARASLPSSLPLLRCSSPSPPPPVWEEHNVQWTPRCCFFLLTALHGGRWDGARDTRSNFSRVREVVQQQVWWMRARRQQAGNWASAPGRTREGEPLLGGGGVNGGSSAPRYLSPRSFLLRPGLIPGSKKGHRKVLLKTDSKVPTLQKD